MPVFQPFPGMPGYGSEKIAKHRPVAADGYLQMLPGGVVMDGAKMRDPDNPDYNASTDPFAQLRLRAGLLIGKVTSNSKWANSVLGTTNGAMTSTGTTLTLASAQQGVELARRVGASGSFKLTGPPTAAGTVRTLTVAYSAISGTSVTVTAMGVNEVQTINFGAAATGGTFKIGFTLASGAVVWTDTIAWSATDATFLGNINTAIDNVLGASLVVATAIAATDTDLGFVLTFSGAGYTALPQSLVAIDAAALTSVSTVTVTRTTTGVDGRFVTGSFIQPTDGSETIRSFLPDGWETNVPLDGTDAPIDKLPIEGNVAFDQLLPWPADASLKQWVRDALNTYGKFVDTTKY